MLKLSDSLSLPVEAVTETFAIVGKRGSGKTNLGVVLVEELVKAEQPVVVIDPVGVWWGLRLDADGKKTGLDVKIIGGEYADVPLEESAGKVLSDFVVETRAPCVLDLSGLRKGAQVRFMTDFAEGLYHRKGTNRDALHVVVDEADAYAPQRAGPEGLRLLGAMEDLIRRGRSRGIGMTLITQRPAVLNKNVLTQAEVLVVFRLTGPHDRVAIDEWVKANDERGERAAVQKELPGLPKGDAYVWSPGWLDVFKRVHVRARRTFDSSATPKPGQRVARRELPPVDLDALKKRIAATIERVEADDPKKLKKLKTRIAELEREVVQNATARVVEVVPDHLLRAMGDVMRGIRCKAEELVQAIGKVEADCAKAIPGVGPPGAELSYGTRLGVPTIERTKPGNGAGTPMGHLDARTVKERYGAVDIGPIVTTVSVRDSKPENSVQDAHLQGGQRKILTALAQHLEGLSPVQIAILTGYAHSGGGFRNYLGALRTAKYADGKDRVVITPTGLAALGAFEPLPSGGALLDYWMQHAGGKAERLILGELAAAHPRALPPAGVANRIGYEATGGGFRNALGRLRTLELVKGRGELKLAPTLADALA